MGVYCLRALIRHHTAQAGEIMAVRWSDYYGAAIFGDGQEIACIPHSGCWLEILGTAETSHGKVNQLLPGQVIRYTQSFLLGDRFELPGACAAGARDRQPRRARSSSHGGTAMKRQCDASIPPTDGGKPESEDGT